jgi:hypothetical protein
VSHYHPESKFASSNNSSGRFHTAWFAGTTALQVASQ